MPQTLRALFDKFNICFDAAYKGTSFQERDQYRQIIKSASILASNPATNKPQTNALFAYMLLEASRLRAIINISATKTPDLKNQNRTLWDKRMIEEGLDYLEKSVGGSDVSEYHLRAAISACHALAKDFESTDWEKILSLYGQYLEINESFDIALERARLISGIRGPKAGIDALLQIDSQNNLHKTKELNSEIARSHIKLNEYNKALKPLSKCLELTDIDGEKITFLSKIEFCKQQIELTGKYKEVLSF